MTPVSTPSLVGKVKGLLSRKHQRRILTIAKNSLHSLTLPVFGIVISYLVIKQTSVERWGEFVHVMIFVQLGAHVLNWGNKEYLLREFSQAPAHIAPVWQSSLFTRFLLFVPLCVALGVGNFPAVLTLCMALWAAALVLFQSYDVFVVYRRDFLFAMLVELAGLLVMATVIYTWGANTAVLDLTALFALVYMAKALTLTGRYYPYITPLAASGQRSLIVNNLIQPAYFRLALPFFLLGLTGMLQSRIDLYSVNYFLPKKEVGQYQVFINLIIYGQSVSAFILVPFIKNIYRLNNRAILKISFRLFALGCILIPPMLILSYFIITYIYSFDLSLLMLFIGGLLVLPIYFYLPIIYVLYKTHVQWQVIWVNLLGLGINLGLNLLLVPGWGMEGALWGSAAAQWAMLLVYIWLSRRIQDEVADETVVSELS